MISYWELNPDWIKKYTFFPLSLWQPILFWEETCDFKLSGQHFLRWAKCGLSEGLDLTPPSNKKGHMVDARTIKVGTVGLLELGPCKGDKNGPISWWSEELTVFCESHFVSIPGMLVKENLEGNLKGGWDAWINYKGSSAENCLEWYELQNLLLWKRSCTDCSL